MLGKELDRCLPGLLGGLGLVVVARGIGKGVVGSGIDHDGVVLFSTAPHGKIFHGCDIRSTAGYDVG